MESRDKLIERLAANATAVRPMMAPLPGALSWLLCVTTILALMAWTLGNVDQFLSKLAEQQFLLSWIASAVTAVLSTLAAFQLSRPDRSWHWGVLPWPAVAAWLSLTGYSCIQNWAAYGTNGFDPGVSAMCFAFVLLLGGGLGTTLALALKRGFPGHLNLFIATMGLATASTAAVALPLFHSADATYLDLVAHIAATGFIILLLNRGSATQFRG